MDATTLDPAHVAILGRMVRYADQGDDWSAAVLAGTGGLDVGEAPFSRLAAMARRGLIELTWRREGLIHTSDRPQRCAKLTEQGRRAYEQFRAELAAQRPEGADQ